MKKKVFKHTCPACHTGYNRPKKHTITGMKICPKCGYIHGAKVSQLSLA